MLFPTLRSIASPTVITLPATASLAEVARTMRAHNIRSVVVTLEPGYRLILSSRLLALQSQGVCLGSSICQERSPDRSARPGRRAVAPTGGTRRPQADRGALNSAPVWANVPRDQTSWPGAGNKARRIGD
ncbi:CBS domain-containing protein [Rhabdochromatium marinum]|uniref:CBS domain-containing protein n=1 Tax=Rhabdochromatium marinum TaxID=48729 RepID=UPI003084560C